jgi:hypothetical protein
MVSRFSSIFLVLFVWSMPLWGEAARVRQTAPADRKNGFLIGLLSAPVPSILSISLIFQHTTSLRTLVGLGTGPGFTFGGGVEYLFFPKAVFTPLAAVGLSFVSTDAEDLGRYFSNAFDTPIKKASRVAFIGSLGGGVEIQAKIGFRIGAGLNAGFFSGFVIVPYARTGWVF